MTDSDTIAEPRRALEPTTIQGQPMTNLALERWHQRFLRQLDLLESEARHLPPVNRQAALTRIAALRASFLASTSGGGRP